MTSMNEPPPVNPEDLKALKDRMRLIVEADPAQFHNEFSLKRFLRAFKTVDGAFQVKYSSTIRTDCLSAVMWVENRIGIHTIHTKSELVDL